MIPATTFQVFTHLLDPFTSSLTAVSTCLSHHLTSNPFILLCTADITRVDTFSYVITIDTPFTFSTLDIEFLPPILKNRPGWFSHNIIAYAVRFLLPRLRTCFHPPFLPK